MNFEIDGGFEYLPCGKFGFSCACSCDKFSRDELDWFKKILACARETRELGRNK